MNYLKINVTWDIIKDNLIRFWDWYKISRNPNITMKFIKDNPDKNWNWDYISRNSFEIKEEFTIRISKVFGSI